MEIPASRSDPNSTSNQLQCERQNERHAANGKDGVERSSLGDPPCDGSPAQAEMGGDAGNCDTGDERCAIPKVGRGAGPAVVASESLVCHVTNARVDQLTGRAKMSPIAISNPADSAQLSAHTAMALPVVR